MKENTKSIKWLMENSKDQRGKLIVLILSNAFFSVLSVSFALAIKIIIDGATSVDKVKLFWGAISLVVIIILQFIFRIIISGLKESIKAKLENSYRTGVFSKILNKKYHKISQFHSGELINRLTSDLSIMADAVTEILPSVVASTVRLLCAVIVLIYLDWIFAVAFIVAGFMVAIILTLIRRKLKNLHKNVQKRGGEIRSFMQECIENLLAVKAFSVDQKINKKVDDMSNEYYDTKMKRTKISVMGHAGYNFIFSAGYIFALIYGAIRIYNGIMTYGSLSAILQLVNNVQVPFATISSVFPKYYAMLASTERIIEIEQLEGELSYSQIDVKSTYSKISSINIENATFSYGNEIILNDVNFTIDKGDFLAITGQSGEGKSTLIKLLLGVHNLSQGQMYFNLDGQKLPITSQTRKLFSYVPQQNMLFSGSIKDNLKFINENVSDKDIESVLEICCMNEFVDSLKEGLDTIIGENGYGLSQGQVQRIAIARALLSGSPIIVLDESTSALDEKTEKQLLNNLAKLNGVTFIFVTHKKAGLEICNKIISVRKGQICIVK